MLLFWQWPDYNKTFYSYIHTKDIYQGVIMPTIATIKQRFFPMLVTLLMVIVVRESCMVFSRAIGFESAGNIIGMVVMFILLMIWRFSKGLPTWLTDSTNIWLKDSGFAFLPITAGAGLLLFNLGDELLSMVAIMAISTLFPLWAIGHLAERWLNGRTLRQKSFSQKNNDLGENS